ncbi:TRAP transporter substrate-binding protein [Castellaniella sp. GW247-6E4]|uniref:TRAP transporter substrate-binding protein n=1 Tax=Castellaniella sp. GW247-6E4 TaxID=3140380 RepID=UPI003315056B
MKYKLALIATSLGFALASGHAQAATKWNMATGFADNNFQTVNVKAFAEDVKRLSGGELEIVVHSAMSLYRQPEIKRAVSTGQIQIGEILLSAYGNEDPMFEADSIPFLAVGYDEVMTLYQAQKPFLEERFNRTGTTLLYAVAWPGTALYTKTPVTQLSDLEGVKMRAYNAATARLAERLGAIPTTVEAVEVPQAFSTGMIQAMITSPTTGVDTHSWEFIQHYLNLQAWHNKNFVIVNQKAFDRLDPKTQEAVRKAAALAEERGWAASKQAGEAAVKTLASKGVAITEPSPELMREIKDASRPMIDEWVKKSGPDGAAIMQKLE